MKIKLFLFLFKYILLDHIVLAKYEGKFLYKHTCIFDLVYTDDEDIKILLDYMNEDTTSWETS